jgi:hypothetical protein
VYLSVCVCVHACMCVLCGRFIIGAYRIAVNLYDSKMEKISFVMLNIVCMRSFAQTNLCFRYV